MSQALLGVTPGYFAPCLYAYFEFTSKVLDQWAYLNGVELDFIRSGKPSDNALIEVFNGRFREECLNESRVLSLEDARE